VTVTDQNGCSAQSFVRISVITPNCSNVYVYLPNVFSPNADGTNDKFYVMSDYVKQATLVVYNRWGEEVYRMENVAMSPENGWDGTHNGKGVCPDVYGWYVTGFCLKGEPFFMKGNVTVMK
jgi:gliding motility-associated-like protein